MFFGYRNGIAKRSKGNENKGCWTSVFVGALSIALIVLAIIAVVAFLATEMTRN